MKKFAAIVMLVLVVASLFCLVLAPAALAADGSDGGPDLAVVQAWSLLVGLLLPFVMGLLLRKSWASWVKFLVVLIVSAVVGLVELAIAGGIEAASLHDWAVLITALVATSQVTFFWFIDRIPGLKAWLYGHFVKDPPVVPRT